MHLFELEKPDGNEDKRWRYCCCERKRGPGSLSEAVSKLLSPLWPCYTPETMVPSPSPIHSRIPRSISAGGNLRLEALAAAHAPALFERIDRDRVRLRAWLPWVDATVNVAASHAFIEQSEVKWGADEAFRFGMWEAGQLAGVIGFERIDGGGHTADLGYWLGGGFEGRGLVARAGKTLCDLAAKSGIGRLIITTAPDNARSRAVAERLGFIEVGMKPGHERLHGQLVDHVVYTWEPVASA